jgi:hypothetical protein
MLALPSVPPKEEHLVKVRLLALLGMLAAVASVAGSSKPW